jgi:hypothetical protein
MKPSIRFALSFVFAVGVISGIGCSSSDDVVTPPIDQVVEQGLNKALETTVVPVYSFFGAMASVLSTPFAHSAAGYLCPDTTGWCSTGTVACTVGANGLDFAFNECLVAAGSDPLRLNGNISAIPGTTVILTLNNLFINNSPAISGTGTVVITSCDISADVASSDATVTGTVHQCDTDPYPTGDTVVIGFGDLLLTIVLNGSSTAPATATQDGAPVAHCTVDLAPDPPVSSCDPV